MRGPKSNYSYIQAELKGTINLSEQQNWELAQLDGLFLHPTLQSLTIANARMASFTSFDSSRERSTDLRELTLITCDIRPDQLHQILSLPKALERFTTKGSAWQGRSVSGEDRVANLDSLRMHTSSLLSLDLDFFFDVDWPPLQPLTLVEFSVSRQLAIELWIVRQHIEQGIVSQKKLLPQRLEELTLKCAGQHVELESYYLDPIYHWLQEGALPNLKRVNLETTAPVPNVPDAIFQSNQTVRQAFSESGVEISMMEEAPGGYIPFECACCWYRYRNPGWMPGWF